MIDRIEVSVIEQPQPRWLAFVNGEMDVIEQVPEDFTYIAIPNNKVAPNLAKQGIYEVRYLRNDASMSYFAMENPVVGGYTPRRSRCAARSRWRSTSSEEIRVVRRGQAIPAQSLMAPGPVGLRPGVPQRDGRLRPRQGAGAARPLRLRRPRRRRLARPARRLAAGPRVRDPARRPQPPADHAVEEEHGCDRRPHRLQDRAVAGEPEGVARRQADDVGRRLERRPRRRASSSSSATARTKGQANHARFDLAEYNRLFRAAAHAARRPRAHAGHDAHEGNPGRLHAVQGARAPHLDRSRAAVGASATTATSSCASSGATSTSTRPRRRGEAK